MTKKRKSALTNSIVDFIKFLVNLAIAIGVVYGIAWLSGQNADEVVGWAALGIAVGASLK